ncbi:MAG: GntR family transcriptional regulator [Candidatus Hydrogenedens sp.]|nr:GntR family transcriptional regulator [Candidatus Hydrogenedens sp.]
MRLYLAPNSGTPIYVQIVEQIKHVIASGRLVEGDELPTVRALAQQLVVNPNTVLRAYQELEHLGLVVRRQGSGTYVSGEGSPLAETARLKIMTEKVDALLYDARHMDFSREALSELIDERARALNLDHETEGKRTPDEGDSKA